MGSSASKTKPSVSHTFDDDGEDRQDPFTNRIDRELERSQQQSTTVVRLLLNNTTCEPIFKDIFQAFGSPLSEDDQNLYRVHLQSKLLEDTRRLCQQLVQLQDIPQSGGFDATTIWDENDYFVDTYNGRNDESKSMSTPQEALKELMEALFVVVGESKQEHFAMPVEPSSKDSAAYPRPNQYCERASSVVNANAQLLLQHANPIRKLWLSRTVQNLCMLQKVHPLWHNSSERVKCYNPDDIHRITSSNFRPKPQDLSGINLPFPVVTSMRIDGMEFEIHDIGGMSPRQRRKHVSCFDEADLFMFVAALSHYDQAAASTTTTTSSSSSSSIGKPANRLADAIDEFSYFLNRAVRSQKLTRPTVSQPPPPPLRKLKQPILLLTDEDIFSAKLQYSSLSEQSSFSDFSENAMDGVEYITKKFRSFVPEKGWDAVQIADGENQCSLRFLLDAARRILMMENLRRSGFFTSSADFQDLYDSD